MRRNISITLRAMLFVSTAITISMVSLLFLVETSIKEHFQVLDHEAIENKKLAIEQFSSSSDAIQKIILWDTTIPDSNFHIEIFKDDSIVYKSERKGFTLKKTDDILPHISNQEHNTPHNYLKQQISINVNGVGYAIHIYLDSSIHAHFLSDFRIQLVFIIFAVWVITILSTYRGIQQGHKPIYQLSKHMSTIQAEQLNSTLQSDYYPRELRGLIESFNSMLAKLNDSFVKLADFSDDVAHELRTPLTNIIMQAQVGLNQERTTSEYKEFLYSMLEELERLTKMVSDMLWIARSDKRLLSANKECLDVNDELSSIVDFFSYLAGDRGLSIQTNVSLQHVFADKIMFRRAISNLLSNAIKYSEAGSNINIVVSHDDEMNALIEVTNECKNISHGEPLRMFDRFYRADSARTSKNDSVGLGLAIVKSIMDVNDGKAWNVVNGDKISFYLLFPKPTRVN